MPDQHYSTLLVEDDAGAARLVEEAFADHHVASLTVAPTVIDALDYLPQRGIGTSDDCATPDLILLDYDLPDGLATDLLQAIKASPTSRRIPVLVLANSTEQADIDEAYDLGATAYLQKPDSYDDLLTLVGELEAFWLTRIEHPS